MKKLFENIQDRTMGESEKDRPRVEGKIITELFEEKEIVETLTYKLGISEDELHNYIDEL